MEATQPRVPALTEDQWTDEVRAILAPTTALSGGRVFNIFATLAHNPKLLKRWLLFGDHVLSKSTLPARERELAILRVGWLCRSEYEWAQHVVIGKLVGLNDDDIERVRRGPEAEGWSPAEAALLQALMGALLVHNLSKCATAALSGGRAYLLAFAPGLLLHVAVVLVLLVWRGGL